MPDEELQRDDLSLNNKFYKYVCKRTMARLLVVLRLPVLKCPQASMVLFLAGRHKFLVCKSMFDITKDFRQLTR
jgi:hypothetical protein